MIYCGLDMSITSPGLTIIDGDSIEYYFRYDIPKRKKVDIPSSFHPYPTCDSKDDMYRYIDNANWIMKCINGREAAVVIEGYALGATGRVFNIAENCAVTKYVLHQAGIPIHIYGPGTIKKFATGNGVAKKGLMIHHFEKETSMDLYKIFNKESASSPLSDIADSYFMAQFCKKLYNSQISIS